MASSSILAAVLFLVSLNLQYWDRYPGFISSIRSNPALKGGTSHGLPVLPAQRNPPTLFFDADLTSGATRITVRLRGDNLYLVGYQAGSTQQWFEFGFAARQGDAGRLIVGSTFLEFGGDYGDLERVAGKTRVQTQLGLEPLRQAVSSLDKAATATTQQVKASSLLVLIQMLSEAVRFRKLSDTVAAYSSGAVPPTNVVALENGWADLSGALLLQDQCPTCAFPLAKPNSMGIYTYVDAAAALGVLLNTTAKSAAGRSTSVLQGEGLVVSS